MAGIVIRAYGEFWDPELVNWGRRGRGNKGSLDGKAGSRNVDAWDQRGIYVLHHDWRVTYVGRVTNSPLGARIRDHRSDWLAGRWDRFSWYGTRGIKKDGTLGVIGQNKNVETSHAIKTMESLLISVAEGLNRSHENIPGATLVTQDADERPRAIRAYLQETNETVRDLAEQIEEINRRLP